MITFDADTAFVYTVIATSIGSLLFIAWLAWKRGNRKRLRGRIIAIVVAVFSLAMLGLKPQIRQAVLPEEAILLTEDTSEDSLRRLLATFSQAQPAIFITDTLLSKQWKAFRPTLIPDLAYLLRNHRQVTRLHVLGQGLSNAALHFADSLEIIPHLSQPESGIRAVYWKSKAQVGGQWNIQGQFENKSLQPVWLLLEGFGIRMDSVEIPANSKKEFDLQARLKESGRFVFELKQYVNKQLVQQEKVPVEVMPSSELRILILEAFPGFEMKFLKNWLAGKQYAVAIRSAISKNKFRTEFINRKNLNLNNLTASVLENFDLLIADEQSLEQLTLKEMSSLGQAIQEDGMALLTLWKEPKNNQKNRLLAAFKVDAPATPEEKQTRILWPDMPAGTQEVNSTSASIQNRPGIRPLVTDEKNNILAAARLWGRGKLTASMIQSAYMWILDGKQDLYAHYWSFLLTNSVNEKPTDENWQTGPELPIIHQPLTYTLHREDLLPPAGQSRNIPFYLAQDVIHPQKWHGTYWPDATGWTTVHTADGTPFWHYIYSPSDWQHIQFGQRRKATLDFVETQRAKTSKNDSAVELSDIKSVPALWFFLLFLCSMAYLWLEQKL